MYVLWSAADAGLVVPEINRLGTRPICWISSHEPSSRSSVFPLGRIWPVTNRECAAVITNNRQQLGRAVLERDLPRRGTTGRTGRHPRAPRGSGRTGRSAGARDAVASRCRGTSGSSRSNPPARPARWPACPAVPAAAPARPAQRPSLSDRWIPPSLFTAESVQFSSAADTVPWTGRIRVSDPLIEGAGPHLRGDLANLGETPVDTGRSCRRVVRASTGPG
jgi:hypothetical protein